jgi:hypothetical protein
MHFYTIRVELHAASWQDYINLANDLSAKGIVTSITANEGVAYHMLPAEYNYQGPADIDTVLNASKASAAKTGKRHAVFVTEASQRKWIGLEPVQVRRSA